MISKLKVFILCIVAISTICSCVKKTYDNGDDEIYPGFVAFDYTGNIISGYLSIFKNLYGFNEYISQTTIEKRDSVDLIYFSDIKITHEENSDIWVLKYLNPNGYNFMSIKTYGKNINDDNAKWTISFYGRDYYYKPIKDPEFDLEKIGEMHWRIKEHVNNNYDFNYSSEWVIKLNSAEDKATLEGSGSLLSIQSPKLKLDYIITEPINTLYKNSKFSVTSGAIKIHATDVDKDITEETIAEIISDYDIRIKYKNNVESFRYSFLW